jgi:hypothetical protein
VASTPANPAIGLKRGIDAILAAAGAAPDTVAGLAHGTTVATNALLQGEIRSLGLIVTSGFHPSCRAYRSPGTAGIAQLQPRLTTGNLKLGGDVRGVKHDSSFGLSAKPSCAA